MGGPVVVRENGLGRYQQEILIGQHRLLADEPESVGGDDAGPSPMALLMGALGTCTSATLRMYAERKGIPLQTISVSLEHDRIEVDGVSRERIVRTITLAGDLSAEQRERLLEIANRCPMHRTLTQPLVIASRLAD
jgi:putative redox protein